MYTHDSWPAYILTESDGRYIARKATGYDVLGGADIYTREQAVSIGADFEVSVGPLLTVKASGISQWLAVGAALLVAGGGLYLTSRE